MVKQRRKTGYEFLADFLKIAPLSHALWRSIEALSFDQVKFKKPVLDLGCGFGEFSGIVLGKLEMGIDINENDLAKALKGKRYKKLQWADARSLPFKEASFSTIISVSVLEHIPDVEAAIKEAHRVLKPDGLFAFMVPTTAMYDHLLVPQICRKIGLEFLGKKYFNFHCRIFKHVTLRSAKWWDMKLRRLKFKILIKEGTLSPRALKICELFLPTAFPSQLWKLFLGRRLVMSAGLRSKILPLFFQKFIFLDRNSDINMFFLVKKNAE